MAVNAGNDVAQGGARRIQVKDERAIRMPLEGLLEALLALDRQKNGWMWRGTDHAISVDEVGDGSVTIEARRSSQSDPQRMRCDRAFVAAALINFCFIMRIPLPRTARKEIEITPDGAALIIINDIQGPGLNLAMPVRSRKA